MSTDYMIKTPDTAAGATFTPEVTQADTIRNKMSVDNLVESPSDSPDITSALILAPPSTPKSTKEEPSSPTVKTPDTVMTDLVSAKPPICTHLAQCAESPLHH